MHVQTECEIGYCSEVNQDRAKLDKVDSRNATFITSLRSVRSLLTVYYFSLIRSLLSSVYLCCMIMYNYIVAFYIV